MLCKIKLGNFFCDVVCVPEKLMKLSKKPHKIKLSQNSNRMQILQWFNTFKYLSKVAHFQMFLTLGEKPIWSILAEARSSQFSWAFPGERWVDLKGRWLCPQQGRNKQDLSLISLGIRSKWRWRLLSKMRAKWSFRIGERMRREKDKQLGPNEEQHIGDILLQRQGRKMSGGGCFYTFCKRWDKGEYMQEGNSESGVWESSRTFISGNIVNILSQ